MKKILIILLLLISFSLEAQTLVGTGGAVYQSDTYTSSPIGLSLRFTVKKFYFDVSSNLSNKQFYQIHKNVSSFPVPNKILDDSRFRETKGNVFVTNIGYMINLPIFDSTAYIIPTIGYGWSQLIWTPADVSYYQSAILFANFGILVSTPCGKKIRMIFGAGTEERFKFGLMIKL